MSTLDLTRTRTRTRTLDPSYIKAYRATTSSATCTLDEYVPKNLTESQLTKQIEFSLFMLSRKQLDWETARDPGYSAWPSNPSIDHTYHENFIKNFGELPKFYNPGH